MPTKPALLLGYSVLILVGCATGEGGLPDTGVTIDAPSGDAPVADGPSVDAPQEDTSLPPECLGPADCGDGLICNGAEECVDGSCLAGIDVDCDDAVVCTVDTCQEPDGSCVQTPNDELCPSGQICHPVQGCRPASRCDTDEDCNDGLACTGTESCAPDDPRAEMLTGCVAGVVIECDDGIACTADSCREPTGECLSVGADGDGDGHVAEGCLSGDDCDDTRRDVHPGAVDICDGANNDCAGGVDDGPGLACAMGSAPSACTTACGTGGTSSCTATCQRAACAAAAESCNACDDDVDGRTDEGFACERGGSTSCVTACGTRGLQTCNATCSGFGACSATEVCNGCDDDADGFIDNGFECTRGTSRTCRTSCGSTGTQFCSSACSYGSCAPPSEVCNGADDDCDGVADNGFACAAGAREACTAGGCTGTRVCSGSCSWGSCSFGTAPTGDTCATAPTITASGTWSFETCGANDDYSGSCGSIGGRDVIYRLVVSATSDLTAEVTSGDFDTVLRLNSGDSCPGSAVTCDDDGGTGSLSRLATTVDPGTYWIVVDGYSSSHTGSGSLSITLTTRGPANDDCGSAEALTLASARTVISGTTASATSDSTCATGADVWYRFTLARTEQVFINTYGTSFDTKLALLSGSCGGTQVDCDDDSCFTTQSQISETLTAGTYYIAVENFSSFATGGAFTMNIERLPVGNDGRARLLSSGTSTGTGATSGSGVVSDCSTGTAPEHLYYWTQCPSDSGGAFSGTTCSASTDYDTAIYVLSGATGASLACNDDDFTCTSSTLESLVTATIPSGAGLFGFYVDGYSNRSGSYAASITRP